MSRSTVILSIWLFAFTLNAQDWCEYKPAKLDEPPLTFENKLISDRFNHTINPDILKHRKTQIEVAALLRPEFYGNGEWYNDNTLKVYSIYNNYALKHAFKRNLELQISYTDLIIKADKEIRDYNKENLNTGVSIAAKYFIKSFNNNYTKLGFFGQVTIPKAQNITNTWLSPEIRFLGSSRITKHLMVTGNLGGVYLNNYDLFEILYAINIKRSFGVRFELFTEFYRVYLKTGPYRKPCKRWLIGLGYYFLPNLYCYSSFEGGWENEDSLNDGRIDIGVTHRFN